MANDGERGEGHKNGYDNEIPKAYWSIAFKVLELILSIICIGLIDDPANNTRVRLFLEQRTIGLAYATFVTSLIFATLFIINRAIKEYWPWKTSALFSFVASILFIAAGATIIRDWSEAKSRNIWPPNTQRMDLQCGAGSVAIVTAIVYIVDVVITVYQGQIGNLD